MDFTDGYDGMPGWVDNRIDQTDRMPEATEAVTFSDSYKHMECLGGMRLQSSY